ncbi:MAG: hypothetical protein AAFQ73_17430, partial [Pseudomonadota bacterium]
MAISSSKLIVSAWLAGSASVSVFGSEWARAVGCNCGSGAPPATAFNCARGAGLSPGEAPHALAPGHGGRSQGGD